MDYVHKGTDFKTFAHCEECPLNDRPYVPWAVPTIPQHNVLFVGQAPGDTERHTGIPFTGQAGKMHFSLCRMAGLQKTMLPHTNTCACYPPEDRKPSREEAEFCFPRLQAEIQSLQPELIIALGDPAMQALTGVTGITSNRGRFLDLLPKYDYLCKVLCCLHPSYVMRSRQWIPTAVRTYELIREYLQDGMPEEFHPEFTLDPTAEELAEYLDFPGVIAWDTETTGLDVYEDKIIGYSFCRDYNTAMAVAFTGDDDPRWEVCKRALENPEAEKCWQNATFDSGMARSRGIKDRGLVYDTRLVQQLQHSDLPSDLDFLRAQHTNIKPYKPPKREMKHIASWGKERMLDYACWDAITTYHVMLAQQRTLTDKQIQLMHTLLIPLVRAIDTMQRRGVLVNVETLAAMYVQCAPEAEKIAKLFYAEGINPRSPPQLIKYFSLKSSNEATLEAEILRGHPKSNLMRKLLEYRGLDNLASKYLKGIYNRLRNGRIHTKYKIEGTGTGRLSSEDPNLQNVPVEMRAIYIPDPGYVFVSADYKQIELWCGAIVAHEDQMLKDLQDGRDIHMEMAHEIFPNEEITHELKLRAKTVVFGTFYGRSAGSISRAFGVTKYEAEQWQLRCVNKYPKLVEYKRRCEKAVRSDGFLTTAFGRIRYVQSITQGYNFPVQSTASDITLGAIVEADKQALQLMITVHDSIVFQVPEEKMAFADSFVAIQTIMERPVPELDNITFPVTYERGKNWYEMETI